MVLGVAIRSLVTKKFNTKADGVQPSTGFPSLLCVGLANPVSYDRTGNFRPGKTNRPLEPAAIYIH